MTASVGHPEKRACHVAGARCRQLWFLERAVQNEWLGDFAASETSSNSCLTAPGRRPPAIRRGPASRLPGLRGMGCFMVSLAYAMLSLPQSGLLSVCCLDTLLLLGK